RIAYPGGVPAAIVGRARSSRVGTAVLAQLGFVIVALPLLTAIGNAIGLHGTTEPPAPPPPCGDRPAPDLDRGRRRTVDGGALDARLPALRPVAALRLLAGGGRVVARLGRPARRLRRAHPVHLRGPRALLDPPPHRVSTHRHRGARRPEHG